MKWVKKQAKTCFFNTCFRNFKNNSIIKKILEGMVLSDRKYIHSNVLLGLLSGNSEEAVDNFFWAFTHRNPSSPLE